MNMCSKPKLNSSEDFREQLKEHLRANMRPQQFQKVGRKRWWQVLAEEIRYFMKGGRR